MTFGGAGLLECYGECIANSKNKEEEKDLQPFAKDTRGEQSAQRPERRGHGGLLADGDFGVRFAGVGILSRRLRGHDISCPYG